MLPIEPPDHYPTCLGCRVDMGELDSLNVPPKRSTHARPTYKFYRTLKQQRLGRTDRTVIIIIDLFQRIRKIHNDSLSVNVQQDNYFSVIAHRFLFIPIFCIAYSNTARAQCYN